MTRRAALLAALLWSGLAAAQPALPVLRGTLAVEGKQVALPEGEWLRAGTAEVAPDVVSVALLQLREGRVTGGVLVQANKAGTPADWGGAAECDRGDLPFTRLRYRSDHDGSCAWVATVTADGGAVDPAWEAARAAAAGRGWALPAGWAEAGLRVEDPLAAVQVRYAFALTPGEALPPGLSGWAATAQDSAERGLLNLLDPTRSLPPLATTASATPPAAAGLPRAVWKTLTFRAIATTIDFSTNLLAIGDLLTAGLLSAWNTVTGPWIYLGHELAWDYFGTPAETRRSLPGIGPAAGVAQQPR